MIVCLKSFNGLHKQEYKYTAWGMDVYICLNCGELEEQPLDCNGG
jgi:hypothetical protein